MYGGGRYGPSTAPFDETVVAQLLPLTDGATADRTALVATAGLFVRPLAMAEFSSAECVDGVATAGADAFGGCGKLAGNVDAG